MAMLFRPCYAIYELFIIIYYLKIYFVQYCVSMLNAISLTVIEYNG